MIKKVLVACALAASVSFAEWDYFPILPQGQGQVVGAIGYTDVDPLTWLEGEVGLRFSPFSAMEVYLKFDYRFFSHVDGEDADADGIGNLPFGVKFQLTPQFAVFGDVLLPIGDKSFNDEDEFTFNFGFSHVSTYTSLAWGSEFAATYMTDSDVLVLNIGDEWDLLMGRFVPYFLLNLEYGVYMGPGGGDAIGVVASPGAKLSLTEVASLDFSVRFYFGELHEFFRCDDPTQFVLAFFYAF